MWKNPKQESSLDNAPWPRTVWSHITQPYKPSPPPTCRTRRKLRRLPITRVRMLSETRTWKHSSADWHHISQINKSLSLPRGETLGSVVSSGNHGNPIGRISPTQVTMSPDVMRARWKKQQKAKRNVFSLLPSHSINMSQQNCDQSLRQKIGRKEKLYAVFKYSWWRDFFPTVKRNLELRTAPNSGCTMEYQLPGVCFVAILCCSPKWKNQWISGTESAAQVLNTCYCGKASLLYLNSYKIIFPTIIFTNTL